MNLVHKPICINMVEPLFHVGDLVTDSLGRDWQARVVGIEGDKAVLRIASGNSNGHSYIGYPMRWLKHVTPPTGTEATMDDTREYLQTVAGGK